MLEKIYIEVVYVFFFNNISLLSQMKLIIPRCIKYNCDIHRYTRVITFIALHFYQLQRQ